MISLDTITFAGGPAGTELTYDAELTLKGALRLLALPMRVGFDRLAENAKAGLERELGGPGERPMRVAVVGAGVSGLVAARELHRARRSRSPCSRPTTALGGHSNTVEVSTPAGEWAVDTGFIVFNDRNYPNFERLLAELGVADPALDDELRRLRRPRRLRVGRDAARAVRQPRPPRRPVVPPHAPRPAALQPRGPRR